MPPSTKSWTTLPNRHRFNSSALAALSRSGHGKNKPRLKEGDLGHIDDPPPGLPSTAPKAGKAAWSDSMNCIGKRSPTTIPAFESFGPRLWHASCSPKIDEAYRP